MLPQFELFGKTFISYDLIVLIEYVTVPILMVLFRKRYGASILKAFYYGLLTLLFGVFALHATSNLEFDIITKVLDYGFSRYEEISSYGYWVFMSPLYLLYCSLFCVDFRKLSDYAALPICYVSSLGKVACFLDGCCSGPEDPNGIYMVKLGYKVFPVHLYDAIFAGIIFILCIVLTFTFSKKHTGYLMPISGILWALQKMWTEQYRTWPSEVSQNFMNSGHTYWFYFEMVTLFGCIIWLIATIICEKKGMPSFETNAIKRKFQQIKENRKPSKSE